MTRAAYQRAAVLLVALLWLGLVYGLFACLPGCYAVAPPEPPPVVQPPPVEQPPPPFPPPDPPPGTPPVAPPATVAAAVARLAAGQTVAEAATALRLGPAIVVPGPTPTARWFLTDAGARWMVFAVLDASGKVVRGDSSPVEVPR